MEKPDEQALRVTALELPRETLNCLHRLAKLWHLSPSRAVAYLIDQRCREEFKDLTIQEWCDLLAYTPSPND